MPHSTATPARPVLVIISGPYASGTGGDPLKIAANRARLAAFALPIYERGHLPIIAEWLALPVIHAAADMDVARARGLGLRIFHHPGELASKQ